MPVIYFEINVGIKSITKANIIAYLNHIKPYLVSSAKTERLDSNDFH